MHDGKHERRMPAAGICYLYVEIATDDKLLPEVIDVHIEPHLTLRACSGQLLVAQTGQDLDDIWVVINVFLNRPLDASAHGTNGWRQGERIPLMHSRLSRR